MLQLANFGLEYVKAWRADSRLREGAPTVQPPAERKSTHKSPSQREAADRSRNGRAGTSPGRARQNQGGKPRPHNFQSRKTDKDAHQYAPARPSSRDPQPKSPSMFEIPAPSSKAQATQRAACRRTFSICCILTPQWGP